MADHRPDVYLEGDLWVMRASSYASCERALLKASRGETAHPMPGVIQQAMDEGTKAEPAILAHAQKIGYRLLDDHELRMKFGKVDDHGQLEVEMKVGTRGVIRCHPDGVGKKFKGKVSDGDIGDMRVIEAKKVKQWPANLEALFAKMPNYAWQLSIEMHGTGLPALYLIGLWEEHGGEDGEGGITEVREFFVDTPPYSKAQVLKRGIHLVKLFEGEDDVPCDRAMYPCGFWDDHDGQEVWAKHEPRAWFDDEARQLAAELEDLKPIRDDANARYKEITDRLKAKVGEAMAEDGGGDVNVKVAGTNVELRWKRGSLRFKEQLARADGVDVDKYKERGDGHWEAAVAKESN